MARLNRDMERAAVESAEPADGMEILVIGSGPGVGLTELLDRCRPARVLAVEPSRAMVWAARRRLASHPERADSPVHFVEASAVDLGAGFGSFDVALAVNSHQLWDPRVESTLAVAGVLRPGALLVSLTHVWAIEKRCPVPRWQEEVEADLERSGFEPGTWSTAHYRSGEGLMVRAIRGEDHPSGLAYD